MRNMHQSQSNHEIKIPGATGSDAVLLEVADIGPANAPVMLLLHGYTDSAYSFSRVAPMLTGDWRLIIPDQRGHGDSGRPASGYTPERMASDAFCVLDSLRIESATVVGHSMGSFIAQRMAISRPERLDALVLLGSALNPRNAVTVELLAEVETMGEVIEPEFIRAFQQSTLFQSVPADFFENVLSESAKLPARLWKQVLRELLASGPATDLDLIRCPVWVVGGMEDAVFSANEQRALAEQIRGSELTLLENIGHDPQWEDPEAFATHLLRFCGRVPAS